MVWFTKPLILNSIRIRKFSATLAQHQASIGWRCCIIFLVLSPLQMVLQVLVWALSPGHGILFTGLGLEQVLRRRCSPLPHELVQDDQPPHVDHSPSTEITERTITSKYSSLHLKANVKTTFCIFKCVCVLSTRIQKQLHKTKLIVTNSNWPCRKEGDNL